MLNQRAAAYRFKTLSITGRPHAPDFLATDQLGTTISPTRWRRAASCMDRVAVWFHRYLAVIRFGHRPAGLETQLEFQPSVLILCIGAAAQARPSPQNFTASESHEQ